MSNKGDIEIVVNDDGGVKVDINLPEGPECAEVDAKLRATLALLGIAPEDVMDDLKKQPVPDGERNRSKS
jgi:hypothetical protein